MTGDNRFDSRKEPVFTPPEPVLGADDPHDAVADVKEATQENSATTANEKDESGGVETAEAETKPADDPLDAPESENATASAADEETGEEPAAAPEEDAPSNDEEDSAPSDETPSKPPRRRASTAHETRPEAVAFDQGARGYEIAPIILVNILFNILTLSFFRFWARTRIRRYLWSRTYINGEAMEYRGTGLELFVSFMIVLFLVLLPLTLLFYGGSFAIGATAGDGPATLFILAVYPLFTWLLGYAVYSARRYRLSRTVWRSIRFGQTGSSVSYASQYLLYAILNIFTLGWMTPQRNTALFGYAMNNTWFGDRKFSYEGGSGALYGPYALAYIGSIIVFLTTTFSLVAILSGLTDAPSATEEPELIYESAVLMMMATSVAAIAGFLFAALPMAWYYAKQFNYFAGNTRLDGLAFRFNATGLSLIYLVVVNGLILIVTLGLGAPFTQMRTFRYLFRRLEADGRIDIESIEQNRQKAPKTGEGLADAFDIGSI